MKTLKRISLLAVLLIMVIGLMGCGGDSPKSLAKQAYSLLQDMQSAGDDDAKLEELEKKMEAIGERAEKLSAADRAVFSAEFARLMGGL